jgi:hypothetical protein
MQCCTCITHNPTNYLKQIKVTFVKYYVQCEQHHIMALSITMNIENITHYMLMPMQVQNMCT